MKNFSWKIGVALFTFLVGTVLALFWFAFYSGANKNSEKSKALESEVTTLSVAPKPISSNDSSYLKGKKDAARDIKAGKLFIKVKGVTAFAQILETELSPYRVKTQSIGCFFNEEDQKHLRGYNEVSKAKIKERIGADVLEKALKKATENDSDASQ